MKATIDFSNVKISPVTRKDHAPFLRSWRTAHAHVMAMEETAENVQVIAELIAIEMKNADGPRQHLLTRLHMSLNRMRGRVEFAEVLESATRN